MTSTRSALGVVLLLTALAYAQTWKAGFVYEDIRTVMGNGQVQQKEAWRLTELRALSVLSFKANHALDGNNPRGYHAFNVAVHLMNGLLVYGIVAAVLSESGALLACTIFLLSTIQSESVAYISGRTELLSGFCVLLAVFLATRPPKVWHLLGIPLALLAGLLTKETAAVGFLLVPLVYSLQFPDLRQRFRDTGDTRLWAFWGVALLACAGLLLWPMRHLDVGAVGSERGGLGYLSIQSYAFWRYLALVVVPRGFTVDHDFELIPHVAGYVALVGVAALAVVGVWARRVTPVMGFGVFWILICFLPRLLIRIPEFFNEHQMYTAMFGVSLLAASLADLVSTRRAV